MNPELLAKLKQRQIASGFVEEPEKPVQPKVEPKKTESKGNDDFAAKRK